MLQCEDTYTKKFLTAMHGEAAEAEGCFFYLNIGRRRFASAAFCMPWFAKGLRYLQIQCVKTESIAMEKGRFFKHKLRILVPKMTKNNNIL